MRSQPNTPPRSGPNSHVYGCPKSSKRNRFEVCQHKSHNKIATRKNLMEYEKQAWELTKIKWIKRYDCKTVKSMSNWERKVVELAAAEQKKSPVRQDPIQRGGAPSEKHPLEICGIIYLFFCTVCLLFYVGQSEHSTFDRCKQHCFAGLSHQNGTTHEGQETSRLYQHMTTCSWRNFVAFPLEIVSGGPCHDFKAQATALEYKWINLLHAAKPGEKGLNVKHAPRARANGASRSKNNPLKHQHRTIKQRKYAQEKAARNLKRSIIKAKDIEAQKKKQLTKNININHPNQQVLLSPPTMQPIKQSAQFTANDKLQQFDSPQKRFYGYRLWQDRCARLVKLLRQCNHNLEDFDKKVNWKAWKVENVAKVQYFLKSISGGSTDPTHPNHSSGLICLKHTAASFIAGAKKDVMSTETERHDIWKSIENFLHDKRQLTHQRPTKEVPNTIIVVHYANKSLNDIRLKCMFTSSDVIQLLPEPRQNLFENSDDLLISFKCNRPTSCFIMNHKLPILTATPPDENCPCRKLFAQEFRPNNGCVYTANAEICENANLTKACSHGPNFRDFYFDSALQAVQDALRTTIEKWALNDVLSASDVWKTKTANGKKIEKLSRLDKVLFKQELARAQNKYHPWKKELLSQLKEHPRIQTEEKRTAQDVHSNSANSNELRPGKLVDETALKRLKWMQEHLIFTKVDKVNTMAFICKAEYKRILEKQIGFTSPAPPPPTKSNSSQLRPPRHSSKTDNTPSTSSLNEQSQAMPVPQTAPPPPTKQGSAFETAQMSKQEVLNHLKTLLEPMQLVGEQKLASLYWSPKYHKNPPGERLIAAAGNNILTPLCKVLSNVQNFIMAELEEEDVEQRRTTKMRKWWTTMNIDKVAEYATKVHVHEDIDEDDQAAGLGTFDFSSMYTNIEHHELKANNLVWLDRVFNIGTQKLGLSGTRSENLLSIKINAQGNCEWHKKTAQEKSHQSEFLHKLTKEDLIRMLNVVVENLYFEYNGFVIRQRIGLPMGFNNSPAHANLHLSVYEYEYLEKLYGPSDEPDDAPDWQAVSNIRAEDRAKARKFDRTSRYIDDCLPIFNKYFEHAAITPKEEGGIYPRSLPIVKTSKCSTQVGFVGLQLTIKPGTKQIEVSVYSKKSEFPEFLKVNRLPSTQSNLPKHVFTGTLTGVMHRAMRVCSSFPLAHNQIMTEAKQTIRNGTKSQIVIRTVLKMYNDKKLKFKHIPGSKKIPKPSTLFKMVASELKAFESQIVKK